MIDFLFPVALFFVFALSALTVILLAARIYQSTTESSSLNYTARTSLSYINEKIHQNDCDGAVYLDEGCIVAKRHIHMSPRDAQAAGVKDGDYVSVKADNERGTVFDHVKIRVDDSFTLEMHIDTDEANASKIATGDTVKII